MMTFHPYRRQDAVDYAHVWAYSRNPAYYDFSDIGGDCTNFASQCILAGTGVMNDEPIFGWYYISSEDRTPSWTGVEFLHDFLVREIASPGPAATVSQDLRLAAPGDIIQLRIDGDVFQHSPVVVSTDGSGDPGHILMAAHSADSDNRPLNTFDYVELRLLHITGYYRQEPAE